MARQIVGTKPFLKHPMHFDQEDITLAEVTLHGVQKCGLAHSGGTFDKQELTLALAELFEGHSHLFKLCTTANNIDSLQLTERRFAKRLLERDVSRVGKTVAAA